MTTGRETRVNRRLLESNNNINNNNINNNYAHCQVKDEKGTENDQSVTYVCIKL